MSKTVTTTLALLALALPATAQELQIFGAQTAAPGESWVLAGTEISLKVSDARPGSLVIFWLKDPQLAFDYGIADENGEVERHYEIPLSTPAAKMEMLASVSGDAGTRLTNTLRLKFLEDDSGSRDASPDRATEVRRGDRATEVPRDDRATEVPRDDRATEVPCDRCAPGDVRTAPRPPHNEHPAPANETGR